MTQVNSTDELINQGRSLHLNNDLNGALQCYQKVLEDAPGNADALHMTGLIANEWGQYQEAINLYEKAISINPGNYQYYNDQGLTYEQMGLKSRALKSFNKALSLEKNDASIYFNIANIYFDEDKMDEALGFYNAAYKLQPSNSGILYNMASCHAATGSVEEAIFYLKEALLHSPQFAEAYVNLGAIHQACGDYENAEASYQKAIDINPLLIEAYANQAAIYLQENRHEQARDICAKLVDSSQQTGDIQQDITALKTALSFFPKDFEFLYNLGTLLLSNSDIENACELLEKAVQAKPDHGMALNNLGLVYKYQQNFDLALDCFKKAAQLDKSSHLIFNNLGNLFAIHSQPEFAISNYQKALELAPEYVPAMNNIANELQKAGKLDDAEQYYKDILRTDNNHAMARFNLSCIQLANGQFEAGWRNYEWRNASMPGQADYFMDPLVGNKVLPRPSHLLPLDLQGKTFLLFNDQGVGDEIFFLRFVEILRQKGAYSYYLTSERAQDLLIKSSDIDLVTDINNLPDNIDCIMGISELPLILGINRIEQIPAPLSLQPCKKVSPKIHDLYEKTSRGKPVLGVTWRAGSEDVGKLNKQINPYLLGQVLSNWKGEVAIMQHNPKQQEMMDFYRGLGRVTHDFSRLNSNLDELLSVMNLLDEYVGVSNTSVHMRESLGKTSRVLMTDPPEWRWMRSAENSPWFPNAKIYRQHNTDGWQQALQQLNRDLLNKGQ
ncbi:MAG: tetratricopeptide repeat protein [Gammaproteobacteria bacterium]|nr:tetratricopeptide repeat protein [Gammaproteobacteria bacterium]